MSRPLHLVILAAGQGKRMRSNRPKVLQPLAGRPLLAHVLDTARALDPAAIHVVHGHGGEAVQAAFADAAVGWVHQAEQLGTGHAVQVALEAIDDDAQVLVLVGDAPLVRTATLAELLKLAGGGVGILTARLEQATGYGRIVRDASGRVEAIVEEGDATPAQREIREVNSGMLCAPAEGLRQWLAEVGRDNAQGEVYLTDIVAQARDAGLPVVAHCAADADEILGANDRWQLAALERRLQAREARRLCEAGAVLADPARVDVRGEITVGRDVTIDVGTVFEGRNELGDEVVIGPHCLVRECRLGPGTRVHGHCVLDGVVTEGDCDIGPFARLRPGTELAAGTRVGNFVEMKKASLGAGSKANHLSYVGDASVGREVNIGAGTITCNYDGVNKHRTVIGDGVFIGSDSQLVAPVEIGAGATIGAGSTITRDAPAGQLTVSRARQVTVPGWKKPKKQE